MSISLLDLVPIGYGLFMAFMDVITFSFVKYISLGTLKSAAWYLVPMFLYSFQPMILLSAMKYETLTIMNLIWNILSDLSVTALGLMYFKEQVSPSKLIGIVLAFISLALMKGIILIPGW